MATFLVTLKYEYVEYRTYEVNADNADHAEEVATEVAQSKDFEHGFTAEVEHIECIEE